MDETRTALQLFLTRLNEAIECQAVQSEAHLEEAVRIRSTQELARRTVTGADSGPTKGTLLEILGYDFTDVDDHPKRLTVIGTIDYQPDYILKTSGQPATVLDLKAPDVSLEKATEQICSYCRDIGVPLGILFNGHRMNVFINARDKKLTKYAEFASEPVATADNHDLPFMVDLLFQFSKSTLGTHTYALARCLAEKARTTTKNRERQIRIRERLAATLSEPPDALLAALCTMDEIWSGLESSPSLAELTVARDSTHVKPGLQVSGSGRSGANPTLRNRVAQVCAKHGWQTVESARANGRLRGLNYRLDGIEEHGYRLVPQGQGVPTGLCIQGKDAPGARRMIQELEVILHGLTCPRYFSPVQELDSGVL
jgi:hypothetical protein